MNIIKTDLMFSTDLNKIYKKKNKYRAENDNLNL